MRVHVVACGVWHEHVYMCTCSRLAAGGSREAPEAARRRPRRSLQPRALAAPHGKHPAPPHTHTTLTRGRQACPSLTGKPNPKHRTSRSPSASTRTRASRTMSTRDQHSCAHRVTSAHKVHKPLLAGRRGPRGCQTLSGMHQHIPARAATCIRGAPGRSSVDIENGGRLDVCTVWPLPAARPPACRPPPRATARTGGSPAHAQTLPPPLGKKKKLFDKDRTFISKV